MQDCWADSQGVRIHYLDTGHATFPPLVPMVFIPGALATAEHYAQEMAQLAPRRCLAVSLRGRGRSEAPETGYSLDHHAADIDAVVKGAGLTTLCLMAYSRGVPYALRSIARWPERLAGVILADYPAHHPAMPPSWVDEMLEANPWANPRVVRALQRESADVLLWDHLAPIPCPVLVLRGGQPDALLSAEGAETYRRHLRDATLVVFEDSGHELWKPDYRRFIETIRTFAARIDTSAPGRDRGSAAGRT